MLERLGAELCGYSIDVPTQPALFESLMGQLQFRDERGDITNFERLKAVASNFEPDFIFHLAAQPLVRLSYEIPIATFQTNAIGTLNLLEVARSLKRLKAAVIVTTDKCYENLDIDRHYTEQDRLGGHDPYSASKACAEIITSSYARSFFSQPNSAKIATARAGNVIGGGDWANDRIVPDCIRHWQADQVVPIRNPISTRPWQHVMEPLLGYLALARELILTPETCHANAFNFGPNSEDHRTTGDLVLALTKSLPTLRTHHQQALDASFKHEAKLLALDCTKAKTVLGWQPRIHFDSAVKLTAEWYQRVRAGENPVQVCREQFQYFLQLEDQNTWASTLEA